ncbi:hypothetical protein Neosp_012242 [[Neocosmospora] mangrovei]
MTTDIRAVEEPIYEVAIECEKQFEKQIARFNQVGDGNGAALLTELSQQFSVWANSMKVFVDGDLCLDRKLQGHTEIQDQVLRGLDLMQANLTYVHMRDVSSEREELEGSSPSQPPRLSLENVEAVASSHGDLGGTSDIWATSSHLEEDLAEGYQLRDIEETAPEGDEAITWDHIRGEESSPIDEFLHQAAEQGAFQSHSDEHKNRAAETLWISDSAGINPQEKDEVDELNGEAERLLRRGGINDLCGSLITYDKQTDIWLFHSLTAADYFKTTHCDIGKAFAFVAMACLKFLITDPCALNKTTCRCAGTATPSSELATKQHPCTLIRSHAIRFVQETEKSSTSHDERLRALEKRFLGSPQFSSTAYQTWAKTWGKIVLTNENYLEPVSSPLFAMAAFGLQRLLSDWWLDHETDLDIRNAQGNSILNLANIHGQDEIRHVITSRDPEIWFDKLDPYAVSGQDSRHGISNERPSTGRYTIERLGYPDHPSRPVSSVSRMSRSKRRSRGSSKRSLLQPEPLSFLFIVNKLQIKEPEMDGYHNLIPPSSPSGYAGEVPSKVMRYFNGQVSEAAGYSWHRDSVDTTGCLFCVDGSGNYIMDPETGSYVSAQEYNTFTVFACNPLLPIMLTNTDPLIYRSSWDLLRIFHPLGIQSGLSQVVSLESPMAAGPGPVRYVAGKSPSWMPGLIPKTYRNPSSQAPTSSGLGGELPVILGLMALNAFPSSGGENEIQLLPKMTRTEHPKYE